MTLPAFLADRSCFADILARNRNIGPGFDLLRLGLAVAILYGHALWVAGEPPSPATAAALHHSSLHQATLALDAGIGWDGAKRPLHVALLPMFFALSGFLVIGSALRVRDIKTFAALRVLRLFPSLLVEISLSALVLGACFTTLPLDQYFSSPGFFRYFLNAFGVVDLTLPGVFGKNPVAGIVNVNLWTLPSELHCYLLLVALMFVGALHQRLQFTRIYLAAWVILSVLNMYSEFGVTPGPVGPNCLVYYFFTGALFYLWRDRIPFNWPLLVGMAGLSYALLMSRHLVFAAGLPLTYVTIAIGMIRFPRIPIVQSGDYSYGIYLYGFPISQALAAVPNLARYRFEILGLTLIFTGLFAAISWHTIEKRCLKLKAHLRPRPPAPAFPGSPTGLRPGAILGETSGLSSALSGLPRFATRRGHTPISIASPRPSAEVTDQKADIPKV